MSLTIEEFRKTANHEQIKFVDDLLDHVKEQRNLVVSINTRVKEYNSIEDGARSYWGLQTQMVQAELDLCELPELRSIIDEDKERLEEMRTHTKLLLQIGVQEYGLAKLGFFQRNYEIVVGKPIPDSYLPQGN